MKAGRLIQQCAKGDHSLSKCGYELDEIYLQSDKIVILITKIFEMSSALVKTEEGGAKNLSQIVDSVLSKLTIVMYSPVPGARPEPSVNGEELRL